MSIWSRIERRLGSLADDLLSGEHREQMDAARAALAEGNAETAAALLSSLVGERPDDPDALALLGEAHLAMGHAEDAIGAFDASIAIDPGLAYTHIGRGEAALVTGDGERAIASFRRAIDTAGGDRDTLAAAYRGLGQAYFLAGAFDKAIRELRKAVAEDADDVEGLAALGQALLASPDHGADEARALLRRATDREGASADAWAALGRAELALGRFDSATNAFEQVVESLPTLAHTGLGDAARHQGDRLGAHAHYLRALEGAPKDPTLHARLGDLEADAGSLDSALAAYKRALQLGGDIAVTRKALDVSLALNEDAVDLANAVLAVDAGDPRALIARGVSLAVHDQLDAARATFRAALERGEDVEAHVALGQLALRADDPAEAAVEAWAALRIDPRSDRARALLQTAREGELSPSPSDEPYGIAVDMQRVALTRPDMADMLGDIGQAVTDFDQPLLVTVMGEFSSGKSTFINAVVRDDIAPMGITPTTATINVLKFGRERGGRIHYRDGRSLTLPWPALSATLHELKDDGAKDVASVEILYPLPELERVSIVDTPGLNSILPEHEEVARAFIQRADAIVWVFTAGQAGKQTEREALQAIAAEGKRVLGVLNKIDQLSAEDVTALIAHIQGELGDLVEVIVPLSARQAFEARRADAEADAGNWSALATALEERFFSQARSLKRAACNRRLATLLGDAQARVRDQRAAAAASAASLGDAASAARAQAATFEQTVVAEERGALNLRTAELYRAAAREVLDLVRPRRLPFGTHTATPADRDYLLALLDAGLSALFAPTRERVLSDIRAAGQRAAAAVAREAAVIGSDHAAHVETLARDATRLVEAQVFDRASAFVRGYLRGGVVDQFFRQDLPRLELAEDAAYHALYRNSPDLDREIAAPLARAGSEALASIADQLEHLAGLADAIAFDVDVGIDRALDQLDGQRRALIESA